VKKVIDISIYSTYYRGSFE